MTHPDPAIRAQYEADRALRREELEVIVDETRRRTGWRKTVEDAKLAHWIIVVIIAFGGGVLTAAWRGGMTWETTRRWRASVDDRFTLNSAVDSSTIADVTDLRKAIDRNRWKLDTIADRQSIVLSILCDAADGLDLRRMCRQAGIPDTRR